MAFTRRVTTLLGAFLLIFTVYATTIAYAQENFRVSYGGYNETAAPMWVGIDKGLFKKRYRCFYDSGAQWRAQHCCVGVERS